MRRTTASSSSTPARSATASVIEEIGKYHPKEEPSFIEVTSDRAQYWLGVGAQPTEAVAAHPQGHRRLAEVQGARRAPRAPCGHAEPKRDKHDDLQRGAQGGRSEPDKAEAVTKKPPPRRPRQGREGGRRRPTSRGRRGPPAAEAPAAEATPRSRPTEAEAAEGTEKRRPEPRARRGPRAPGARHRRAPGRRLGARQAAAPRLDPRGPGAPRRPRQGHRPRRAHRHRAAHRRSARWPAAAARASTSSTSTGVAEASHRSHGCRPSGWRPCGISGRASGEAGSGEWSDRVRPVRGHPRGGRRPDRQAARRPRRGVGRACAPTSPSAGSPTGADAAAPDAADAAPPSRPRSPSRAGRAGTSPGCWSPSTELADRTAAEAARGHRAARHGPTPTSARGPRGVLRPPAGRARGRHDRRRRASARSPASCTAAPRTCSRCAPPTAARCWCRSSTALVPDGRRRRAAGSWSPTGRACSRRCPTTRTEPCAIDVVSIFPDYLAPARAVAAPARRGTSGLLDLRVHDLRDWTHDRHRTVDDTPYGGGAGMVMRPEPWGAALDDLLAGASRAAGRSSCRRPSGEPFTQALAARARRPRAPGVRLRPLRGHRPAGARRGRRPDGGPRGLHRRLRAQRRRGGGAGDHRGRRAAAARLHGQPGVAGRGVARRDGLLEYPVYTKPAELARPRRARRCCCPATTRGSPAWRHDQAVRRTAERRPTCCTRPHRHASRASGARARAPRPGPTPASCSPCSWPAGCRRQQANDDARRSPPCARPAPTSRPGSPSGTTCVRTAPARLVGAVRAPARGRGRLGHRAADGRPRPARPRPRPAGCSAHVEAARAAGRDRRTTLVTGAGSERNLRMYRKAGYRAAGRRRTAGRGAADQAGAPGADLRFPAAAAPLWQTSSLAPLRRDRSARHDGGSASRTCHRGACRRRSTTLVRTIRHHRFRG